MRDEASLVLFIIHQPWSPYSAALVFYLKRDVTAVLNLSEKLFFKSVRFK